MHLFIPSTCWWRRRLNRSSWRLAYNNCLPPLVGLCCSQQSVHGRFPQGGLAYVSLWGLSNSFSRSQGDRRDKRPAYVSPCVLRREGRRECKAFKYGYIFSTWPWIVAHRRSWCQGWDRQDKFPGMQVPWGARLRESHLELPSTVSRSPAGSDVAVHPYDSPTND